MTSGGNIRYFYGTFCMQGWSCIDSFLRLLPYNSSNVTQVFKFLKQSNGLSKAKTVEQDRISRHRYILEGQVKLSTLMKIHKLRFQSIKTVIA